MAARSLTMQTAIGLHHTTRCIAGDLLLVLHSHNEHLLILYELQSSDGPPQGQQPSSLAHANKQISQPRLLHIFQRPDSLFSKPQEYHLMATFAPDSSALLLHYCSRDQGLGVTKAQDALISVELPSMHQSEIPLVWAKPGMPPFLLEAASFSPDSKLTLVQMWSPACSPAFEGARHLPALLTQCVHFCYLYSRGGSLVARLNPVTSCDKQLTACDRRCLAAPAWSPDSQFLVSRSLLLACWCAMKPSNLGVCFG